MMIVSPLVETSLIPQARRNSVLLMLIKYTLLPAPRLPKCSLLPDPLSVAKMFLRVVDYESRD